MNTWTITLHAQGPLLRDNRTKETVVAAAESLAERFGLRVIGVTAAADSLSAALETDEVTAVGFAAELRRNTNAWYASKNGGSSLWITPD